MRKAPFLKAISPPNGIPMSKRSRRKSPRRAPSPSQPEQAAVEAKPRRIGSFGLTLLVAALAFVTVFLILVFSSSGPVSRVYEVGTWDAGNQRLGAPGQPVEFPVGANPILLRHHVLTARTGFGVFEADIFVERKTPVRVFLAYRDVRSSDPRLRGTELTNQVREAGWQHVRVTSDDAEGLDGASEIGLQMMAVRGQVRVGVRNARLVRPSWFGRAAMMLGSLLKRRRLTQGSNNFNPSLRVAGRGYGFLLWGAFAICVGILVLRRFALRERFAVMPHLGITILVLLVIGDARNHADYVGNAAAAVEMRAESKDLDDYLGRLENYFPWFADMSRYLREKTSEDVAFTPQMDKETQPGTWQAIHRLWYYVLPRKRVWNLDQADVALFYGLPTKAVDANPDWRRVDALPSGVLVYERTGKK